MTKKSKSKTKKKTDTKPPEQLPPEQGHNRLDDSEQQALAIQHKGAYEKALAVKKKADAEFKNTCKRAKAEMGKDAIDTIKTMIECDTPEGEARVAGRVATTITAARWVGVEIGTQFGMFAAGEMGGSRLFEAGKRAAMEGEPCKAPADATADGQQEWIKGWHAGNDARNKNLADAVGGAGNEEAEAEHGEPPSGVSRKEWQANLRAQNEAAERGIAETARRMGSQPATHRVSAD